VLAFLWFRTQRPIAGGASAAVAIATRTPGVVMWPALAWAAWRSSEPTRQAKVWAAVGLALATSGFLAYCAYIYRVSGNPFEWAATLQRWNYRIGGAPWTAIVDLVRTLATHPYAFIAGTRMGLYDTLYGAAGIAFLAVTPFVWRRLGAGYGLFVLLNLLVPLSSGVFEGMGRYCSVLFPVFIWLASIRSRSLQTILIVSFAMLYTLALALFTTIHPIF